MQKKLLLSLLILGTMQAQAQWSLSGNAGTNPATNFIGTTDNQDLIFKRNNLRAGLLNLSDRNTAFGVGAFSSSSGSGNTAIGTLALSANTNGLDNAANGTFALRFNTSGNFNTANGNSALHSNISGSRNTANGSSALYNNTSGTNNTANGRAFKELCQGIILLAIWSSELHTVFVVKPAFKDNS